MAAGAKRKLADLGDVSLEVILDLAQRAARAAGALVDEVWDQRSDVKDTKSNARDLVTITDEKCEQIVTEMIQAAYPGHKIIGEEAEGSNKYELTAGPTWTIDPIDGTTNFVHRIPYTCVLIAFLLDKQPVVAVTYDPISKEMFYATKGGGAFLASPRHKAPVAIHVSECDALCRAVVGMEPGYGRDDKSVTRLSSTMECLMRKQIRTLRMGGACGLNAASVASGRWDLFLEEGSWTDNVGPKIWDFAPAKLIVEEAGGVMLNIYDGGAFDLMGRSVFAAANRKLADEALAAMKERKK